MNSGDRSSRPNGILVWEGGCVTTIDETPQRMREPVVTLVPGVPAATPASVTAPTVSVVIPTLNEARNLPHVFSRLPKDIHEVILSDGRSHDNTIDVARALLPGIVVVHETRRGKGAGLKAGFGAATGDIIVMLDADGSANPAEIPRFVEALVAGADFAKGSRYLQGGGSADLTRLRRYGNGGLTALVNLLYGTRYTDLCYGYNAFWRHCLPYLEVDCDGFEVETLINIRCAKARLRVVEVPSYEEQRIHGKSNLRPFRDGWRVQRTIMKERFGGRSSLGTQTAHVGGYEGQLADEAPAVLADL
jgi:glycosyltransferase involved in cell wall biosynthesis